MEFKENMNQRFHWLLRKKVHHLLFWATYQYLWWVLYEGSTLKVFNNLLYPPVALKFLFYVIFHTLGVYFCLYFLIPRFLENRKYVLFITTVLGTILSMALLIVLGYYVSAGLYGHDVYDFFGFRVRTPYFIFKTQALPSSITVMALGMSIKLAKNYLDSQRKQQLLQKEKLTTELKFLKSQFNPHFLFNTINSIFVLIDRNPAVAKESMARFSELLRYQLYECNEPEITLSRELDYIKSYMELEKLRQNENFELKISLDSHPIADVTIAPFLLTPFIENAFKHVSKKSQGLNWISIEIKMEKKQMFFEVRNSISNQDRLSREPMYHGGLGLENVRRRLKLLYPDRHELTINLFEDHFVVNLSLILRHPQAETKSKVK